MYCTHCGKEIDAAARFCPACGAVTQPVTMGHAPVAGQLVRLRYPRMIAGVCSGFSQHYGWDLSLVRVVTALMIVCTGVGLIAYIAAWIIIPEAPYELPAPVYPGGIGPAV